ncbi:poly-gamma-glutamate synthase PgsB [bacterium]|nr:poly-gamma-glutamate synthase PgsB [bacterium]
MSFLFIATALAIALGFYEFSAHQKRVKAVKYRIHVNGTRGKSSVVRLIAAGLREGGISTMAKTTGTLPRIIDTDGLEVAIKRSGGANIIEQLKIFRYFTKKKPQAVVVECMAVNPEYQWICEQQIVRATTGVITNSRLDHVLEMGPSIENITKSLCNTLPQNGVLFTSEQKMFWLMSREAKKKNCKIYRVHPDSVSYLELANFSYIEHAENVSLALAVCEYHGIDRETALRGMYKAYPDVGALHIFEVSQDDKVVQFVHAMAANDPESTLAIWQKTKSLSTDLGTVFFLIHTRADRYDRTIQLLQMIKEDLSDAYDYLILSGEKVDRVYADVPRMGLNQSKAIKMGAKRAEEVFDTVLSRVENIGTVFAIGNVGRGGLDVAHYFSARRRPRQLSIQTNQQTDSAPA